VISENSIAPFLPLVSGPFLPLIPETRNLRRFLESMVKMVQWNFLYHKAVGSSKAAVKQ
jgi:hypothetical protein